MMLKAIEGYFKMKKIGLLFATTLLGISLVGCGNSSSHKATVSSRNSSSKVIRHHKRSSSRSSNNVASKKATNQSTTQQSNANRQTQAGVPIGGNANQNQDNRPEGTPANFKEYVSYTTDGHRMTQWNDAGRYEGDPDVQYQTIKSQTDEGY